MPKMRKRHTGCACDELRGERRPQHYALKFHEPIQLWKWAARNSRRADGGNLAMKDFFKRSVRACPMMRGEPHETFVRRALFAALRALVVQRRAAGENVPEHIEEALAAEIAHEENADANETLLR